MPSELNTYSTAGSFTYTIPEWASHIYVAALGGGGAGGSSTFAAWGGGGSAGSYDAGVLYRGQSFASTGWYTLPLTISTLSVTVGAGGARGATSSATNGYASTVSAAGEGTLISGGGGTRGTWDNNGAWGSNTAGYTFLGTTVPAPRDVSLVLPDSFGGQSGAANPANAALGSGGCGGSTGFGYGWGTDGRQGGVWILAYGDRPAFFPVM